jgi:hypothetical protein
VCWQATACAAIDYLSSPYSYPLRGRKIVPNRKTSRALATIELDLKGQACPGPTVERSWRSSATPGGRWLSRPTTFRPVRPSDLAKSRGHSSEIVEDDGTTFRIEIHQGEEVGMAEQRPLLYVGTHATDDPTLASVRSDRLLPDGVRTKRGFVLAQLKSFDQARKTGARVSSVQLRFQEDRADEPAQDRACIRQEGPRPLHPGPS